MWTFGSWYSLNGFRGTEWSVIIGITWLTVFVVRWVLSYSINSCDHESERSGGALLPDTTRYFSRSWMKSASTWPVLQFCSSSHVYTNVFRPNFLVTNKITTETLWMNAERPSALKWRKHNTGLIRLEVAS